MSLRPYQTNVRDELYAAWGAPHHNVLVVMPTGAGKSVLLADVIHSWNGASCAIAHRQELVSQISIALARDGVVHKIIGDRKVIEGVVQLHIEELGRSFYDPRSLCAVAGVDTIVSWSKEGSKNRWALLQWAAQVTLWVIDEAHHLLTDNKWGQAVSLFPNARGLGVTATPERADGKGLGRHADGLFDHMVLGPTMRDLINGLPDHTGRITRYLTDYRVFCPPSNLDLSAVSTGKDGDYIRGQLALKTKESTVLGDVVAHYLRLARGKRGVTFVPDTDTAAEMAARFNNAGVPAEVVTAKTPGKIRRAILKRFAKGELLQLVNVDLFGEGFDLPAIEVVSMARATQSYSLFCLDPETEVLTPSGWKQHDTVGHEVVGFDRATGSTRVVPVTGRVKRGLYPDEVMYQVDGPHLDMCVSDKHDLLVRGRGQTCVSWQKQHAEVVASRGAMYQVPVAGEGSYEGSGLSTSDLHFLGWFLSDGSRNKINNSVMICQACNKTSHVAHIEATLKGCGFKYSKGIILRKNAPKEHHDLVRFAVSMGKPRGRDKHLTGWGRLSEWVDKSIPDCYDKLTRSELIELLKTLNLGDGVNNHSSLDYKKNTLTITCGDNQRMADRIQALCVTRGLRCNLATAQYGERAAQYILHIRDCATSTLAGVGVPDGKISGKKAYKRTRLQPTTHRPEFVWCVSNPLGTLITRRNGKVVIMGNCQQFGRALRLMEGKEWAIIIDHVGNIGTIDNPRHGLPDRPRVWTLDRRDRKSKAAPDDVIPMRNCIKGVAADIVTGKVIEPVSEMTGCFQPYEACLPVCPYCGCKRVPPVRTGPEYVDGDLHELDAETLAAMRGEVARVDAHPDEVMRKYEHLGYIIAKGHANRHGERQTAQAVLREAIGWWGAWQTSMGRSDSEGQRRFYFKFGVDVLTAQSLGKAAAEELAVKVTTDVLRMDAEHRGVAI